MVGPRRRLHHAHPLGQPAQRPLPIVQFTQADGRPRPRDKVITQVDQPDSRQVKGGAFDRIARIEVGGLAN